MKTIFPVPKSYVNSSIRAPFILLVTFVALCLVPAIHASAIASWTGTSGLLPTSATPPWLYYGEPADTATLTNDFVTLETNPDSARATYFQEYYALAVPDNLVIEATMRYVSGSSATPGRTAAGISFFPSKGVANWLWIGPDAIFVNAGGRFIKGAEAAVDTNDAFHTYRIELQGTGNGSGFDVFYDGALMLSGTLFPDDEDQDPELGWGDVAYEASGISEWKGFSHNAAIPEPTIGCSLLAGIVLFLTIRRGRMLH